MADPPKPPKGPAPRDETCAREARLAAALRSNLRRRKGLAAPKPPVADPD